MKPPFFRTKPRESTSARTIVPFIINFETFFYHFAICIKALEGQKPSRKAHPLTLFQYISVVDSCKANFSSKKLESVPATPTCYSMDYSREMKCICTNRIFLETIAILCLLKTCSSGRCFICGFLQIMPRGKHPGRMGEQDAYASRLHTRAGRMPEQKTEVS